MATEGASAGPSTAPAHPRLSCALEVDYRVEGTDAWVPARLSSVSGTTFCLSVHVGARAYVRTLDTSAASLARIAPLGEWVFI